MRTALNTTRDGGAAPPGAHIPDLLPDVRIALKVMVGNGGPTGRMALPSR
jgi:hypothetical protein